MDHSQTFVDAQVGALIRGRMPMVAFGLCVATIPLSAVRFVLEGPESTIGWLLAITAFLFLVCRFLYLRASPHVANYVLLSTGMVATFGMAALEGGLRSESMIWVPFIPFLAVVVEDARASWIFSVLATVGVAIIALLDEPHWLPLFSILSAIWFLSSIGRFLERARINAEEHLSHLAISHPLTGLPSRAAFDLVMERTQGKALRDGEPYTLVFVDVDGLKVVNDSYGHRAGDQLLLEVANRLRKLGRSSEQVFHVSGDEFSIIVDGATNHDGMRTRLRAIEGAFTFEGKSIDIRISIGVSEGLSDSESSLAAADSAMYADKKRRKTNQGADPQANLN